MGAGKFDFSWQIAKKSIPTCPYLNVADEVLNTSDTTGPSLVILFYFLAKYPVHAERIFDEITTIETSSIDLLATLPHLNGFINETMRLVPAALTMGTRITPPEGITIDGTWIPGGIKIAGPRYTIFRSEFISAGGVLRTALNLRPSEYRCRKKSEYISLKEFLVETAFADPLTFIPERWYSRTELVKDKRAFAPFGLGKSSHKSFSSKPFSLDVNEDTKILIHNHPIQGAELAWAKV